MMPGIDKTNALVAKKYREYLLPCILAVLAGQLGIVVDSLMVGNFIGPEAMTGVSVCMPLEQIFSAVVMLLSIGAEGMIAAAAGARKDEEANQIFSAVVILNAVVSAVFLVLMVPSLHRIAEILAGQDEITPHAYEYLQIMIWRTPFMMLMLAFGILINADGMVKLAGQGTLLAQVVNITLDLLLIRGLNMGLHGAAIATVASDAIALFYVCLVYMKSKERRLRFTGVGSDFFSHALTLICAGLPTAAATALISIRVLFVYHILESTGGKEAMQIYSVCMNILTILSLVAESAQQAMMPILGMLYGEKDYRGIRMLVRYVLRSAYGLAAVFLVILLAFPQLVLKMFNLPPELVLSGQTDIRLFAISTIGVLLNFLMMYYYTTIDQTVAAGLISVVEGILVVVPAAWLLVSVMGARGVWFAFILAEAVSLLVILAYARFRHRKDPEQYADVYLIPEKEQNLIFDVSVKAGESSAARLSEDAVLSLEKDGIPKDIAGKAGVALEEITVNLSKRQPGMKPDLDVRIVRNAEHVIISLRDNGLPFDPMTYSPKDQEQYMTDGILVFKAMTRDIQYSRVLSLNQTIIEI